MNKITIGDLVSCTTNASCEKLDSLYKIIGMRFVDDEIISTLGGYFVIKDVRTDKEYNVLGNCLIVWKPVIKG